MDKKLNKVNEKENNFIAFLNNQNCYKNNFRFLFVYTKIDKNLLQTIFEELLKDVIIIDLESYYLVIYHNKERVRINDYLDALCEDYGVIMNVFEGFLVSKENNKLFLDFIKIFDKYYNSSISMYSIKEFILNNSLSKEEKKLIKELLLYKYNNDLQFEKFVYTLFENNLNVSRTAKDIYMHRNTVNNKLTSFENDTTLTLQNFKDAIVIYELMK